MLPALQSALLFLASLVVNISIEVAFLMGSGYSASAASYHVAARIVPFGQRQREMRDAGEDPINMETTLPDKYKCKQQKSCPNFILFVPSIT
jgi:hypothetical protein